MRDAAYLRAGIEPSVFDLPSPYLERALVGSALFVPVPYDLSWISLFPGLSNLNLFVIRSPAARSIEHRA
jgi:hypothetical protein